MQASRSRLYGISGAAIVLALAVSAQSCSKSRERPDSAPTAATSPAAATSPTAATSQAAREAAALEASGPRDKPDDIPVEKPAETPVAMKASPKASTSVETDAKASKAVVSSNLAGVDRRLVERPFDALAAGDFELGELYGSGASAPANAALSVALLELERSLLEGEPPYGSMGAEASALARARFGDAFPLSFARVRFARPVVGPALVASVPFRAFADDSGARAIIGLAILAADDDGTWVIEHLELDPEALEDGASRSEPWDPYDTSRQAYE
ncbi:MAG TPA: hypothetical protein PK179_02720 [Spirochaetales bacterium]|nr:hypothetical protein [Spirochaetales bacterium]HPM73045.1 hypothetical protein [Spirochaetales bacterium]